MPAFIQFCFLIITTLTLHESMHYYTAKGFGFNPQRYFNVSKTWKRSNVIYSMTFNAPKGVSLWKVVCVYLSGPLVEISFILFGIMYNSTLIIFVNICSLIGSYYDFERLFNLFKYRNHYKAFGYFGV